MEHMTSQVRITSIPMSSGSSQVTGSGTSITADNVPNTTYLVVLLCNPEPVSPWPNPHVCPNQTFRVRQNGEDIFVDEGNATYTVERETRADLFPEPFIVPKNVGIQGSSPAGSYQANLTNLHWTGTPGESELVMDMALTATPGLIGGGGGDGGDDPPIIQHH